MSQIDDLPVQSYQAHFGYADDEGLPRCDVPIQTTRHITFYAAMPAVGDRIRLDLVTGPQTFVIKGREIDFTHGAVVRFWVSDVD